MAYCNSYNSVKLNDNYYRTLIMHLTGQFISICLKRSLSFEEFKGSSASKFACVVSSLIFLTLMMKFNRKSFSNDLRLKGTRALKIGYVIAFLLNTVAPPMPYRQIYLL